MAEGGNNHKHWPVLEGIEPNETLLRYINRQHVDEDGNLETMAFLDRGGMSVDRHALVPDARRMIGETAPYVGSVSFTPMEYIDARYKHDPLPDNEAHALVWHKNGSKSAQNRLAKELKYLLRDRWDAAGAARRKREMSA